MEEREQSDRLYWSTVYWNLFDDDSVKKKLTVMGEWDAMSDDSRNAEEMLVGIDDFLHLGRKYKITVTVEDTGACQE